MLTIIVYIAYLLVATHSFDICQINELKLSCNEGTIAIRKVIFRKKLECQNDTMSARTLRGKKCGVDSDFVRVLKQKCDKKSFCKTEVMRIRHNCTAKICDTHCVTIRFYCNTRNKILDCFAWKTSADDENSQICKDKTDVSLNEEIRNEDMESGTTLTSKTTSLPQHTTSNITNESTSDDSWNDETVKVEKSNNFSSDSLTKSTNTYKNSSMGDNDGNNSFHISTTRIFNDETIPPKILPPSLSHSEQNSRQNESAPGGSIIPKTHKSINNTTKVIANLSDTNASFPSVNVKNRTQLDVDQTEINNKLPFPFQSTNQKNNATQSNFNARFTVNSTESTHHSNSSKLVLWFQSIAKNISLSPFTPPSNVTMFYPLSTTSKSIIDQGKGLEIEINKTSLSNNSSKVVRNNSELEVNSTRTFPLDSELNENVDGNISRVMSFGNSSISSPNILPLTNMTKEKNDNVHINNSPLPKIDVTTTSAAFVTDMNQPIRNISKFLINFNVSDLPTYPMNNTTILSFIPTIDVKHTNMTQINVIDNSTVPLKENLGDPFIYQPATSSVNKFRYYSNTTTTSSDDNDTETHFSYSPSNNSKGIIPMNLRNNTDKLDHSSTVTPSLRQTNITSSSEVNNPLTSTTFLPTNSLSTLVDLRISHEMSPIKLSPRVRPISAFDTPFQKPKNPFNYLTTTQMGDMSSTRLTKNIPTLMPTLHISTEKQRRYCSPIAKYNLPRSASFSYEKATMHCGRSYPIPMKQRIFCQENGKWRMGDLKKLKKLCKTRLKECQPIENAYQNNNFTFSLPLGIHGALFTAICRYNNFSTDSKIIYKCEEGKWNKLSDQPECVTRNSVFCPSLFLGQIDNETLQLPKTLIGHRFNLKCGDNYNFIFKAKCLVSVMWSFNLTDVELCKNDRRLTNELRNKNKIELDIDQFKIPGRIENQMSNLRSRLDGILQRTYFTTTEIQSITETILGVVDDMVSTDNLLSWRNMSESNKINSFHNILTSVEDIGNLYGKFRSGNSSETHMISKDQFVLSTKRYFDQTINQFSYQSPNDSMKTYLEFDSLSDDNYTDLVVITYPEMFHNFQEIISTKHVEDKSLNETMKNESSFQIVSDVLSININDYQDVEKRQRIKFSIPVKNLTTSMNISNETVARYICSYLHMDKIGNETTLEWKQDGCQLQNTTNSEYVVCECNHLTHFAVLMNFLDVEISEQDKFALEIITYIGCSISIICLTLSLIIFIFGSHSGHQDRLVIHRNFVGCLLIATLIFVCGINQRQNDSICMIVAASLHFFFLAAWMWMLAEGIQIYFFMVLVFEQEQSYRLFYYLSAYCLPAALVLPSLSVYRKNYLHADYCWMSSKYGVIYFFILPVAIIIVINTCFLLTAMYRMFQHMSKPLYYIRKNKPSFGNTQIDVFIERTRLTISFIRGAFVLGALLGLTWIFGYFHINKKHTIAFQYLFAIFNSLQGFFIFIFYCVLSERVRDDLGKKARHYSFIPSWIINKLDSKATSRKLTTNTYDQNRTLHKNNNNNNNNMNKRMESNGGEQIPLNCSDTTDKSLHFQSILEDSSENCSQTFQSRDSSIKYADEPSIISESELETRQCLLAPSND
ncbi:hypothetical protein SNEBB_000532 [Seison nebaliae]|nr:hypothetical protein SNEBB_000532 [Seison nebaliae]